MVLPEAQDVFGRHPAGTQMPPLHICPAGQFPQSSRPSHPSPIVPQNVPPAVAQVNLVQPSCPQTLATLAPHVVPAGHAEPQSRAPPHPSPTTPQKVTPLAPQVATLGWQFAGMQI